MLKNKVFLAILFLVFATLDCLAEPSESIFAKLKYQPDWSLIPNLTEAKENFFLENNLDYDEEIPKYKTNCWSIDDYDLSRKCYRIQQAKLLYKNYGTPMNCKRGDFFRSIIEDASLWLLSRDWSEKTYKNWFYNFNVPYYLKTGTEKPVCQAFADGYEIMNGKEGFGKYPKKLAPIKKLDWDYNVAQILPKLKTSKMIEVDFNNDGQKELFQRFTHYKNYNSSYADGYIRLGDLFLYDNNADAAKNYLKQPDLIIKDKYDYLNFIKKFNGKNIGYTDYTYFNPKLGHWFFPDSNLRFFQYENQNYVLVDYHTGGYIIYRYKQVFLIKNTNIKKVCEFRKTSSLCIPNHNEWEIEEGAENLLCQTLLKSDYLKKPPRITKYEWDYESFLELNDSSKFIELDLNKDGNEELIYATYFLNSDTQKDFVNIAVFSKNIRDIKNYLKQHSSQIKTKKDFLEITEKFEGRTINTLETLVPDYEYPFTLKPIFFEFNNKPYFVSNFDVLGIDSSVFSIEKNKAVKICSLERRCKGFNILKGKDNDVCKAVANDGVFVLREYGPSEITKNLAKIKKYDWDYDIAGIKEYTSEIVEADFNNDGKKELILSANDSITFYEGTNAEKIKAYLKKPDLVLKSEKEIKKLIKRFHGKKLRHNGESYPKFSSSNFFEYNGKTYVYDYEQEKVFLIEKKRFFWNNENKIKEICSNEKFSDLNRSHYDKNKNLNMKITLVKKFPPFYIHEDVPLYDKSFVDEINSWVEQDCSFTNDRRKEAKEYLYNKVKKLCGTDLSKINTKH